MVADHGPRLRRRHAELLLDGRTADGELARLLAVARHPGDPGRPAPREREAVEAFRSAQTAAQAAAETAGETATGLADLTAGRSGRRQPARSARLRPGLALKVLAVCAAVATVSGAAVAATSRIAGNPGFDVVDRPSSHPTASASPTGGPAGTVSRGGSTSRASSGASSGASSASSASASASSAASAPAPSGTHRRLVATVPPPRLASTCLVWRYQHRPVSLPPEAVRRLAAHQQKLARVPTRTEIAALIRAAGAAAKVPAYCMKLVNEVCSQSRTAAARTDTRAGTRVRVSMTCRLHTAVHAGRSPGHS
jgi:hypothetical protein